MPDQMLGTIVGPPNNAMNLAKSPQTARGLRRLLRCWTGKQSWHLLRPALIALALLGTLSTPRAASACICGQFPWPTIVETASTSDIAIIGMIVARGGRDGRLSELPGAAAFVDVEILEAMRGPRVGTTVRVWDTVFGTDCSQSLSSPPGSLLVLTLARNRPRYRQDWVQLDLKVGEDDYLLHTCAEYIREVNSLKEAAPLAKQIRAQLRRGKR